MSARSARLAARTLVLGLALANVAAAADDVPELFAPLRKSLEARLTADKVPSLSLAVSQDGQLLWEDALGWADVEKHVPATVETSYALGSVSKPITATALMILVERGELALDEPANSYLGEAALRARVGDVSQATLRRLASHSSGLARYGLGWSADEPRELPGVEEQVRRYGVLLREPGETYEYSNLGYTILAHILERRAHEPFGQLLREEIFDPLGMSHSSLGPDAQRPESTAVCYGADGRPVTERESLGGGASGVYASVRDLLRFARFQLEPPAGEAPPILSAAALAELHRPASRVGPHSWYGLGWRTEESAFGATALMHTGQTTGSTACLVLVPERRLCVVALANCANDLPWRATQEIVNLLVPAREPPAPAEGHERFGRRDCEASSEWLGHWTGLVETYERALPVEMWFEASGAVQVQLSDQPRMAAGGLRVEDGYLRGSIDGDLGTSDTKGRSYRLHFKLKRRGEVLNGSITASERPGERVTTLSHWMEVRRRAE